MALIARLRRSLPAWRVLLCGTPAWALVMGANAAGRLWLHGWRDWPPIHVALLFALGAALAFPIAVTASRFLSMGRRPEPTFATALLCLASMTVMVTSGLYALDYRSYYAEWHAPAFTITWTFQLVFTTLTALYQFAVLGLPLLFPLGFAALFTAAFLLARVEMRERAW